MLDFDQRVKTLLEEQKPWGETFIDVNAQNGEAGASEVFNFLHREDLIHVMPSDVWYEWNGVFWEEINLGKLHAKVRKMANIFAKRQGDVLNAKIKDLAMKDQQSASKKDIIINAFDRIIGKLQARTGISNIASLSDSTIVEDSLEVKDDVLDKNPYILTVKNGVLDLRFGDLMPPSKDDYCTFCAPVEWKGVEAPCPIWEKTVFEILGEKKEVVEYFQRLIGMALLGKVMEKNFLMLYGEDGDSGKTTLFEIIYAVLGSYASPMPVELLLDQGVPINPNAPTPAIMDLRGKRIVWASEPADNRRFSVDRIKLMSGGDTLTGRYPYQLKPMVFAPSHTLFMLTNHEPHASSSDSAFWKRLRKIDCPFEFVEKPTKLTQRKVERGLKDEIIKKEASGVLAWMVKGCIDFITLGSSSPPETITEATAKYRQQEDKLLQFMDECVKRAESSKIQVSEVYDKFKEWHEENVGKKVPSKQWFTREMRRKGFVPIRGDKGRFYYEGLSLPDDLDEDIGDSFYME